MNRTNLRAALIEIAGDWGIRSNDLQNQFHQKDLNASAQLERIEVSEARALQIKTPAFRVCIKGKQPRLLYLESCTRLHDRNQKTPRLIIESRQRGLQQDDGLTVTSHRRQRGWRPEELFPPLRESRVCVRTERATRDR